MKIGNALDLPELGATPATPPAGREIVWFTSAGMFYKGSNGITIGPLAAAGGGSAPVVSAITSTTTAVNNAVYLASGTFSVTIPTTVGTHVLIKNIGAGIITVLPATGQIDSAANFALPTMGSIETFSDGTNVWIF